MSKVTNYFMSTFKNQGYFKYPLSWFLKKEIFELSQSWRLFCGQDLSVKQKHLFHDLIGGYEYKGSESLDFKENFHLSLDYLCPDNLTDSLNGEFLRLGQQLIRSCQPMVYEILRTLDSEENVNLHDLINNPVTKWTLRFLHYFPTEGTGLENNFLAHSHIDKGLTIHLYEDYQGLEILWKKEWVKLYQDWNHSDDIIGYFGMLGQLYSDSKFPALCHRVSPTTHSRKYGRNAIVLFIDFGDKIYDKETYGSTQKVFPNGENYNMPIEEFSKYFKNK